MDKLIAWLSDHWPEAVSALAAVSTLLVVLWDRWKPVEAPVEATLWVHRDEEFGVLLARLMIARPSFGFYEIDTLEAPGFTLAERKMTHGYDPKALPPENALRCLRPGWIVDMGGQHQTALFWFWALESSKAPGTKSLVRSMRPQNVLRVRASITFKAAKTLKSKITITSNAIA